MWKVTLKDGREVRLRFLTANDKERLFRMFSSMSEKALEWSMAPYTIDNVERRSARALNLFIPKVLCRSR